MFVRFRKQSRRLSANLTQTRRVAGKVQSEHVAALGSVDDPPSVRERFAFWAALPERLARLGNRLAASEQPKIYEALHARIPMTTPDDQRAIQEENAKDDERFWDALRDLGESMIEGHKGLIAAAEAKNARLALLVADSTEKVERAMDPSIGYSAARLPAAASARVSKRNLSWIRQASRNATAGDGV